MTLTIRPSTRDDAQAVARLSVEFSEYLRSLGDPDPGEFTQEKYLADGCGPSRAFSGLIAELDGVAVGYLFYCPGYASDLGGRITWIVDLFVTQCARGRGVARALMRETSQICRASGGSHLFWALYTPNTLGQRFYEKLGAQYTRDLAFMYLRVSDA